jgi:thiol-disulfide isomerase/thioredoxin
MMRREHVLAALAMLGVVTVAALLAGSRSGGASSVGPMLPGIERFDASAAASGVELQYFKIDSCPYCQAFDPVWEELKAAFAAGPTFRTLTPSSPEADTYKVSSFPHIQAVSGDKATVYNGPRSLAELKAFVEQQRG